MIDKKKRRQRKRGSIIAFEGISAAGKSEAIKKLKLQLETSGQNSVIIKWNSNPLIKWLFKGLDKRNALTPGIYSLVQMINFLLDYFFKYKYYLHKGYIILADRYIYTAVIRDTVNGLRGYFSRFVSCLVYIPDLIIFVDTHPLFCCHRIEKRNKPFFLLNRRIQRDARIDNKIFCYLDRQRKAYQALFEKPFFRNIKVVKYPGGFRELSQSVPVLREFSLEQEKDNWQIKAGMAE